MVKESLKSLNQNKPGEINQTKLCAAIQSTHALISVRNYEMGVIKRLSIHIMLSLLANSQPNHDA